MLPAGIVQNPGQGAYQDDLGLATFVSRMHLDALDQRADDLRRLDAARLVGEQRLEFADFARLAA